MKLKPFDRKIVAEMITETFAKNIADNTIGNMGSILDEYGNQIKPFMYKVKQNKFSSEEKYNELKKIFRASLKLINAWVIKCASENREMWENSEYCNILEDAESRIDVEYERRFIKNIDKSKDDYEEKYKKLWERCDSVIMELKYMWKETDCDFSYIESPTSSLQYEEVDEEYDYDEYEGLYSGFYAYYSSKLPDKDKQSLNEEKITVVSDMNDECNIFFYSDANDPIVKKEIEEATNKGIIAVTLKEFYDFDNSAHSYFEE